MFIKIIFNHRGERTQGERMQGECVVRANGHDTSMYDELNTCSVKHHKPNPSIINQKNSIDMSTSNSTTDLMRQSAKVKCQ
jgi:hypothetical protein